MAIILRSAGDKLSHAQLDGNFTDLDTRVHAVAQGGTGASTAPVARVNLGVTTTIHAGQTVAALVGAGATTYIGTGGDDGSEIQVSFPVATTGNIKEFYFKAGANLLSGDCVARIRKNGAATAAFVTVTAESTALFSITGLSIAVTKGDLLSISLVAAAGTGNIGYTTWSCVIE